jgi:hypothetical protein
LTDNCPKCGRNLALVGRVHNCVANAPDVVANAVANALEPYRRYKDKEKRKAYMREYMRKKRDGRQQDR